MSTIIDNKIQEKVLKRLIEDLGMEILSREKQEELVVKMKEVLLKRIFLQMMEKIGEQGREEYEKLIKGGNIDPEKNEDFFKENITDYEGMIENSIVEFKQEMMLSNK